MTYKAEVETHTDGTLWIKCIAEEPKRDRLWNGLNVYHGDATKKDYDGDDYVHCPHCGAAWWIEYD